ncbi:hypothetical protein [Neptuniibacter sp. QD37_11]|uniref:hypothetical protein n=1 Tax=Neptuniibacter sp. QD37_11 TaxID=3398209 RepID=UPI0039F579A1
MSATITVKNTSNEDVLLEANEAAVYMTIVSKGEDWDADGRYSLQSTDIDVEGLSILEVDEYLKALVRKNVIFQKRALNGLPSWTTVDSNVKMEAPVEFAIKEPQAQQPANLSQHLVNLFTEWCDANGLPHQSAEELQVVVKTEEQKQFLKAFIDLWNVVESPEPAIPEDDRPHFMKEFPNFTAPDDFNAKALGYKGFKDISWHNDEMPSWENNEKGLKLWVEYPWDHYTIAGFDERDWSQYALVAVTEDGEYLYTVWRGDSFEALTRQLTKSPEEVALFHLERLKRQADQDYIPAKAPEIMHTGGNCMAVQIDLKGGGALLFTDDGGCGLPELGDCAIGVYNTDSYGNTEDQTGYYHMAMDDAGNYVLSHHEI